MDVYINEIFVYLILCKKYDENMKKIDKYVFYNIAKSVGKYNYYIKLVKQDWTNLQYVKEQTHEICLKAIKQHSYALQYVKEQIYELCMEAVSRETESLCSKVKQNSYLLKYVKDQNMKYALKQYG